MKKSLLFTRLFLGALLSAVMIYPSFAGPAENLSQGDRVVVASSKSFEQTNDAIKSLVAKNGMMVMAEVDQGNMLSMTGFSSAPG